MDDFGPSDNRAEDCIGGILHGDCVVFFVVLLGLKGDADVVSGR